MPNIVILVAAHKKYQMPKDSMYLPIHVGAYNKESIGYQSDAILDNISNKNPYYCELTALYWAWKNMDYDYLGLAHYRRHFKNNSNLFKSKFDKVLTYDKLNKIINEDIIILPKKRHYYIETNKSQYLHAHHKEGLENTEKIIKEYYPDYLNAWNKMLNKRSGHRFNMFIMSKKMVDQYCSWLFDILFKVEGITDISNWNKSEQRIYGYLAERLLDVWIYKNNYKVKEIKYMFMEKQNWFKKIFNFIKRKLKGNKNEEASA